MIRMFKQVKKRGRSLVGQIMVRRLYAMLAAQQARATQPSSVLQRVQHASPHASKLRARTMRSALANSRVIVL
jgi:hypothetical protein